MVEKLLVVFSVCLLSLMLATGVSAEAVPDAIGIWTFDEGDDKVAVDYSGNGNDGKFVGGGEVVDGKFGKAVKFNGMNQCIEVQDSDTLDIDGDQVTITCWFWWEGSGDGWQTFVSKGPMSGTNENWAYFINSGGRHTHFIINPGASRPQINSNVNAFEPKQWHFTAATYDGKKTKIYIDGNLVTDEAHSGNLVPNANTLRIGHREGSSHWWNGMLDEIAVFRRALSEDEITAIMEKGLSAFLSVEPKDKLSTAWGYIKSR